MGPQRWNYDVMQHSRLVGLESLSQNVNVEIGVAL